MSQFGGVVVPVVAPLTVDGAIDEAGLGRIVARGVDAGVHSFFALGANSEFAGLTDDDRDRMVRCLVDTVGGRAAVYVNVGECSLRRTVANVRRLPRSGVTAVAVLLPYFFGSLRQSDLVDYYQAIDDLGIPFILYEGANPRVKLELETVKAIAGCRHIIGLKVEDGRMIDQGVAKMLATVQGAPPLIVDSYAKGAVGSVTGLANVIPDILVALHDAVTRGDLTRAREVEQEMLAIREAVVTRQPSFVAGIKSALDVMGICRADVVTPHPTVDGAGRALIAETLAKCGVVRAP